MAACTQLEVIHLIVGATMTARPTTPVPVITGMGHYFPATRLTNHFYEGLDIGTSATWIEERVGILERRTVLALEDVTKLRRGETSLAELRQQGRIMPIGEMCREPWSMAKNRTGDFYADPNVVIAGTSVPDWDIPANACSIAATLGLETTAFDVNSACSSFVVDLHVARGLLCSGQATDLGGRQRRNLTGGHFNQVRCLDRCDLRRGQPRHGQLGDLAGGQCHHLVRPQGLQLRCAQS